MREEPKDRQIPLIPMPMNWESYTLEEKTLHCNTVGDRILEHRYRYYMLNEGILDDFEYDGLERYYQAICLELGVEPLATNMVDFDLKRLDAQAAKLRVDMGLIPQYIKRKSNK